MATLHVMAEAPIAAPAARVYAYLADYREHHPRILPPAFSDVVVEQGGVGAGTIVRLRIRAGGRSRAYRLQVDEPEPGRLLRETDLESDLVTTFTVLPEGAASRVRIETIWQGAGGIGGIFERLLAPPVARRLYTDELARLDRYVRRQAAPPPLPPQGV